MDRCRVKLIVPIFCAALLILPVIAGANDFPNQGFSSEVSQSLRERFGMCNEFLDVKWVDKARLTGLLRVDAYKAGKTEPRYLIVHLEKPGSKGFIRRGSGIFYEISEKEYSDAAFEKFLKGASYNFSRENVFMNLKGGKRSERYPQEPLPFEAFQNHRFEFPDRSFSGFTRTVCVAYPDQKNAFVVEAKKPFLKGALDDVSKKAFDAVVKYAREKCSDVSANEADCNLAGLKDSYGLDVNNDGKYDYIFVISGGKDKKARIKRYTMLSSGEGYTLKDSTGCLGSSRFLYGYSDGKVFNFGGCAGNR